MILKGKDPQAGLVVTPRACGICGASHLTCAAWALDTAWGTTVPRNAILARNLGQIVESLQSLPRHHYGLFMIDFTNKNYAASPFYEEAVKRYSPFTGTSYEAGVTIFGRYRDFTDIAAGMSLEDLHAKVISISVWTHPLTEGLRRCPSAPLSLAVSRACGRL